MKTIDRDTAKKYIYATNGQKFSAVFTKKNGEKRLMNCMLGVTDGVKGVGRKFDPDEKGLVSVFDVDAEIIVNEAYIRLHKSGKIGEKKYGDFRFINLLTLEKLTIDDVEYTITKQKGE